MQQTFPVQTCRCKGDGFTLVEVVITLAIASIVLGVVASVVITSLRAEQKVLERNEANLFADRLITTSYLNLNPSNTIAESGSTWTAENALFERSNVSWTVWNVYKKDFGSAKVQFAVR